MASKEKIILQNQLLEKMNNHKPVDLSRSDHDFITSFMAPRRVPDHIKKRGE